MSKIRQMLMTKVLTLRSLLFRQQCGRGS